MHPGKHGKVLSGNRMDTLNESLFWEFYLQIIVTEDLCKVVVDMMKTLNGK